MATTEPRWDGNGRDARWGGQPPGTLVWRGRLFLSVVLLAAAMPIRIAEGVPVVNSFSILDLLLLAAASTLFLDTSYRALDIGYRQVFWILSLPLLLSIVSFLWSQDHSATLRSALIYFEGVVAYLFVIRELNGLSPDRIVGYVARFAYLLVIPALFLLLHVPGFEPQIAEDVSRTSGEYLSYFTRLSHPVLGRSNNLAAILALLAPVLLYWGQARGNRKFTVAGFVSLAAIFLTLSRGTLLSFVVAGMLYGVYTAGSRLKPTRRSFRKKIAVVALLGGVAIATFYVVNPQTHALFKDRLTLANVSGRSDLISDAWAKIENRPFLGYGGGVAPDGDTVLREGVHNTYLQQILDFGIPLGLAISVVLCSLAVFFLAHRRRVAVAGVLGYTVMVELVSFLFESTFEGTVLRVLIYMYVGIAVALLRSVEASKFETIAPA